MSARAQLLLLALGMFALGTDGYVITGLLPDVARELAVTESAAGQLVTVFALAYALGAPLLGVATAGLPRRPILIGSLTVFTVANIATAMAGSYPAMLAVRVVAALAAAVFAPAAAAAAATLATAERRGRALATVSAGIAVATAVGVPIGTLVGGAFGWRATFLAVAALGALTTAGLAVLLPPLSSEHAVGIRERVAVARVRGVPSALLVTMLWIAGAFTMLTYLGPVLAEIGGVTGGALSAWLLIFGLAASVGNVLGGRAADRYPTTWLVVLSTSGLTVALAAFGMLAAFGVSGAAGAAASAVVLAVWGIFGWSFAPIQQHRMVGLAPEQAGLVLSLNTSAIYLGISLGGVLGSIALAGAGVAAIGWTAACVETLAVAAAAGIALRAKKTRRGAPGERAEVPVEV